MKHPIKIPKYTITNDARKGLFIKEMSRYNNHQKHSVAEPHRDDHYTIVIIQSGVIELMIDFKEVIISRPALLVISPEQVHQMINMKAVKGWLINVDTHLLSQQFLSYSDAYFATPVPLVKESAEAEHVFSILHIMSELSEREGNSFIEGSVNTLLHATLQLFLSVVLPLGNQEQKTGRKELIYRQFKSLLEEHYNEWKQPSQYATEMLVSATHLNDTVKEQTGLSVSQHIQNRNILEAKRQLYFTNKTVSVIGFELGYEDPVYFGKLFKKITDLTPLAFRAKFRE